MSTPERPIPEPLPYDELEAELGEHPGGREALAGLRTAVAGPSAKRGDVEGHVGILQQIPTIRAKIANWFDSPTTQGWLDGLSEIGL